ncbi:hypothetical protein NLG97_g9175 [Lecanicillium saksenae]|uniref:Uncharacterized protein n=1 Tax=Lecanicillium saksenae TaxID=468837 RepID=A0ACC1QH05_9HYPO|nr:hypothetical protein NLG97_g9175 [Lecanicillium saksenae]
MASTQTATTTIHLKDYDSSSTSAPVNTGAEPIRDAALNTSTTTRRRGAQPPPVNADADDDAAIIAASRALDEECPDGGYGWIIVLSGAMLMWLPCPHGLLCSTHSSCAAG